MGSVQDKASETHDEIVEEVPETLRNFSADQLKEYDGESNEKVYLAFRGKVLDVSGKANVFGPGGAYHHFAGKDFSQLHNEGLDSSSADANLASVAKVLTASSKFPVLGNLVQINPDKEYTLEELGRANGRQEIPEGYSSPPILIAVKGTVFDMSFGGNDFYGPGRGYHVMAGRDASRALAKMSLDVKDVESPNTLDLTESEKDVLENWYKKFCGKYPICGKLISP
uniref:Cytochrome b5 heme-binding domain-containing protein n=1 Tax=Fibrocapsa japonica TaxID=94617 RepID=A0A7S2V6T0_9STRA|mmetsp:Transcript_9110/g.14009  ORF Transcript_9110/g.14009 Transcript_9110/m.14009 type:complete len:226 (+) Transcript_9110:140-817(+)|eukprot:CAMPEP_0113945132 /NCGR_PEP_ID=MMETSP1339-20121228/38504_1 /TAXON_ID=94617 /ORGANISM="Fibrocapsa japonica" /LENGTH=225 /DNA_ID=CAMNT_0000950547 /DNA_START=140 /DNA_END=817 /DNA_ORIENTATION=- /assembly_acc=CAM_ASM_000762